MDTVGVLTQYRPLLLNEYIGNGLAWDLDRRFGGVQILAPYQGQSGADWYRGTANAIWQNMEFINRYDAKYVLILSGDHIYKMDYAKMLAEHKKSGAACTIAVLDVPLEEASRFGIMSTREDGSIFKFTEKPKNPDSTKASMGIYVFTKDKLEAYLKADNDDPESSNDFGKNIIPTMLASGEKMMSYSFEGYWKDVGTISSLWEANMDLLGDAPAFSLLDESWRIYSRHSAQPPQYIAKGAVIENSSVTAGCQIYGTVKNSVLGANVTVGKGAVVEDSVIMNDVVIEEGATVRYAILDEKVTIGKKATVGASRESGAQIAVVGADVTIQAGEVVAPGAMLSES